MSLDLQETCIKNETIITSSCLQHIIVDKEQIIALKTYKLVFIKLQMLGTSDESMNDEIWFFWGNLIYFHYYEIKQFIVNEVVLTPPVTGSQLFCFHIKQENTTTEQPVILFYPLAVQPKSFNHTLVINYAQ